MNQARSNNRLHFYIARLILVLWFNRVPRKYDFKLGKYTKSMVAGPLNMVDE